MRWLRGREGENLLIRQHKEYFLELIDKINELIEKYSAVIKKYLLLNKLINLRYNPLSL
jgi:transcription termination factor NusB